MGQEGHAVSADNRRDQLRHRLLHEREHRSLRVKQKAAGLGTGDKQHTLAQAAPAVHVIAGRTKMIRQEHHPDAGHFRSREHLLRLATRVRGIAGMGMEHAPEIHEAIGAGQPVVPTRRQRVHRGLHRLQTHGIQARVGRMTRILEGRSRLDEHACQRE